MSQNDRSVNAMYTYLFIAFTIIHLLLLVVDSFFSFQIFHNQVELFCGCTFLFCFFISSNFVLLNLHHIIKRSLHFQFHFLFA